MMKKKLKPREKSLVYPGTPSFGVVILAAGLGKRMRSPLPKVLHELGGKPLLYPILSQIRSIDPRVPIALVVGHGRTEVERYIRIEKEFQGMSITFVVQPEQRGTGHAARCAIDSPWGVEAAKQGIPILILPGDLPLITRELLQGMVEPLEKSASMRLLTCVLENPTGYGRVVRKPQSRVQRIIEEKDASPKERKIQEVATSIYLFNPEFLRKSLTQLSPNNVQKEYYLTDLVLIASQEKKKIQVFTWENPEDLRGVNDPWELAQTRKIYAERTIKAWALRGVQFLDATTVRIEAGVTLGDEVVIDSGVILQGSTSIGNQTRIGPGVVLKNVQVGPSAHLKAGTVGEDSTIEAGAQIGPYAHLRPGTHVGPDSKIGNFVELKKTRIGASTSIAHLSYLGDAEVGSRVNIGCGFVTCNFDGRVKAGERKHKTIIEDDVFLGSACQAVAPIRIGQGSYIASGSTLTEDVECGSLAIARARQVNKPGYAKKLK